MIETENLLRVYLPLYINIVCVFVALGLLSCQSVIDALINAGPYSPSQIFTRLAQEIKLAQEAPRYVSWEPGLVFQVADFVLLSLQRFCTDIQCQTNNVGNKLVRMIQSLINPLPTNVAHTVRINKTEPKF